MNMKQAWLYATAALLCLMLICMLAAVANAQSQAYVASAASYRAELTPDSIGVAFTAGMQPVGLTATVTDAKNVTTQVVNFFANSTQFNFFLPASVATGPATIRITDGAGKVFLGNFPILRVAPGLFSANADGLGPAAAVTLRVRGQSQGYEEVTQYDRNQKKYVFVPIDLGPATDQVFLVLFGTGIRLHADLPSVRVTVGGVPAEVLYAGPQGQLTGLDQINVRLPRALAGRGVVTVVLMVGELEANRVDINIK